MKRSRWGSNPRTLRLESITLPLSHSASSIQRINQILLVIWQLHDQIDNGHFNISDEDTTGHMTVTWLHGSRTFQYDKPSYITDILTHLAYRANAKKVWYIKQWFTVLKSRGKYVLPDVIYYWKMTSFMTLDGVTSFLLLKGVTNSCKRLRRSLSIGGSSSVQWRKDGRS